MGWGISPSDSRSNRKHQLGHQEIRKNQQVSIVVYLDNSLGRVGFIGESVPLTPEATDTDKQKTSAGASGDKKEPTGQYCCLS